MPSKKKSPAVPIDPTAPGVEIEIEGKLYRLCFNFTALALAEQLLRDKGVQVNMLAALDFVNVGASRLPHLLYASLLRYQPAMTFEEASALLTMRTALPIHKAVIDAYIDSMPEKAKAVGPDPTQAPAAE